MRLPVLTVVIASLLSVRAAIPFLQRDRRQPI